MTRYKLTVTHRRLSAMRKEAKQLRDMQKKESTKPSSVRPKTGYIGNRAMR